ncbi:MAG: hypothetical protein GX307_07500 [Euryarchaeota archaeon]|nr:hypothetical protein [Euryarchaeota archaeon]
MELMDFITVMLLTLGLFLVLAGIFTAYFGSGKSRIIGAVLLVVGLLVGVLWVFMDYSGFIDVAITDVVWTAFVNILAAAIGALIAIGAFLLAIMKS